MSESISLLVLCLIFILGGACLTAFKTAIIRYGYLQSKSLFREKKHLFFIYPYFKRFFIHNGLIALISFSRHIFYALYVFFASFLFANLYFHKSIQSIGLLILYLIIVVGFSVCIDLCARLLGILQEKKILSILSPLVSLFLLFLFPITGLFLKITQLLQKTTKPTLTATKLTVDKSELLSLIQESDLGKFFNTLDQKLLLSFLTFKEKVAREVMIPRIDIFALDANTSIRKAAELFIEQDYSRIPVYKETLDHIIGLLMYKDILKVFSKHPNDNSILDSPIESIIKPVIYAPENKKISSLFQEFRKQQRHLAIIVNEYGGTEGIVTIEDILEELVGEIEDEYDIAEDKLFWKLPNGNWIVDAKMSIIDIEKNLDITLPHSPEYETIGGLIFHKAGEIPSQGWQLHLDNVEMEVLISNERRIEKIRIQPIHS